MRTILFRLWVVGTVLWVGLMFFASTYDSRPNAFTIYAEPALILPAVIFVVGAMLVWAFSGLSRN